MRFGGRSKTEGTMCYVRSTAYQDRKAEDARKKDAEEKQRTAAIERLAADANKRAQETKPESAPVREAAPAK
jgi:hypothetical protein